MAHFKIDGELRTFRIHLGNFSNCFGRRQTSFRRTPNKTNSSGFVKLYFFIQKRTCKATTPSNTRLKLLDALSFAGPVCAFALLGVVSWLDVGLVLGFHQFNPSLVSTNFASCCGYVVGGFRVSHPHHFLENTVQIIIHSLCPSVHKKAHNLWELSQKEIGTLLCLHHATFFFFFFLFLGVETR